MIQCTGLPWPKQIGNYRLMGPVNSLGAWRWYERGPLGKSVNAISNLYHGTYGQNNGIDRVRDGTSNQGERNGNAVFTTNVVKLIRASTESHTALAKQFGVSITAIYEVRKRRRWAHVN